jgi:hypothetical protein
MIGKNLPQLIGTKRSLLVLLASSALFTAGCSNMLSTTPVSNVVSNARTIGGKVHGGSQNVVGATVKLYFAGQGVAPTEAATTTSASDGSFSFTNSGTTGGAENGNIYSCPSSGPPPLVYAVSRGGNTLGDGNSSESNSAAVFIGVYGNGVCVSPSSFSYIMLNEVTTVATMLAVQQYYDPATEGLSADATGEAIDAFYETPATIANLADVTSGTAATASSIAGKNGLTVSVIATPETSKINLLANILTSCINNASSSASNCQTLFASAVPPPNQFLTNHGTEGAFAPAADVLQALDYMLINPTSGGATNMSSLFALAGGNAAAFVPALAVQPSDWTVAISYSSSNNCANGGAFLSAPNSLAIDEYGDVWVGNGQTTNGNVVQLSGSGAPLACNSFGSGATAAPGAVFIDSNAQTQALSDIWSALSGSSTITRYNPNTQTSLAFTAPGPVLAIAGDGGPGDIFFTVAGGVYEIAGGASATTATTPTLVSSAVTNATSLMPDLNGNLWASSGTNSFQELVPSTTPPITYTVTPINATANTQGLVVTNSNNVVVSSVTPGNSISYFGNVPGSGYLLEQFFPVTAPVGGLNQPAAIALDGASNIWIANMTPNANPAYASNPTASPTLFGVSEVGINSVSLSPDTASGSFQKAASYLNGSSNSSIIVDQSGNVWIAGGATSNNFITEIVGAGVPIYQPYALGIVKNRFQSIP